MDYSKLYCPDCGYELTSNSLTEIYGYCCLNEDCDIGNTLPTRIWYSNGILHREDGPAMECANGIKKWYSYGELHREDGPAIEDANGDKYWYLNGERHREDGPAVEKLNGTREWWVNDERHRIGGPAVENTDVRSEWWENGKIIESVTKVESATKPDGINFQITYRVRKN